ncbi:GntR family transcriptional regulator [Thalassospira sp. HF15]|uniref:GntR family transcriptional regulator n=1 Tax=Thalassospira sp. HF15 TaxID=2722755 RepID=UPI001430247A|nr:GntR family transcriptional regulator [Thalassospira sp. HF15]NIY75325.1 GntR family transcriptional regulator [Thalassospira sp. HF15]
MLVQNQNLSASISDNLASLLEADIIFGRLRPMQRLTEEELVERHGVSRSPVREAIRMLAQDGLIVREPRKGIWVSPLSVRDFDELSLCRIELEGLAAEQAALADAPEEKAKFNDLFKRLEQAQKDGDAHAFFLTDVEGSMLTYRTADNKTLIRLLESLDKQALRYRFHAYSQRQGILDLTLDDTRRIYDAIIEGDGVAAKQLTREIISKIWKTTRDTVRESFEDAAS